MTIRFRNTVLDLRSRSQIGNTPVNINTISYYSQQEKMVRNKTKEMIIDFRTIKTELPTITRIADHPIARVTS